MNFNGSSNFTGILIRSIDQLRQFIGDTNNGTRIGEHRVQLSGYSVILLTEEDFYSYRLEVWIQLKGGYYWSIAKFTGISVDIDQAVREEVRLCHSYSVEIQTLSQLVQFCRNNNPDITQVRFIRLDRSLLEYHWDTINQYFGESYHHCVYHIPTMISRDIDNSDMAVWGLIDQTGKLLAINAGEVVQISPVWKVGWLRYSLARQGSGFTALTKYWTLQQLFEVEGVHEVLTHSALGNTFKMNLRLGFDRPNVGQRSNILFLDTDADITRGPIRKTMLPDSKGVEHIYNSSTNMVFRYGVKEVIFWDELNGEMDWD